MIQLLFGDVRVTDHAVSPVLVLKELDGERQLAIWISAAAGAAILSALEPESVDYPSTHDLLVEALASQGALIERLNINSAADGVFHAELSINGMTVTCRASDGVALALRCGAPMFVADEVMADAGVTQAQLAAGDEWPESTADEVEQFRAFLANVNADDFDERS